MVINPHGNRKFNESDINNLIVFLRKKNIRKTTDYLSFRYENGGECDSIKLPSNPWQLCRMAASRFFAIVNEKDSKKPHLPKTPKYKYTKIERKTLQEHYDLANKHRLLTSEEFMEFVRNMDGNKEFYACPWSAFGLQRKQFFENAFTEYKKLVSEKKMRYCVTGDLEHVAICIENKLTNSRKYRQFYLRNRHLRDMLSRPWDRYSMSENQFFKAVRDNNMKAFL